MADYKVPPHAFIYCHKIDPKKKSFGMNTVMAENCVIVPQGEKAKKCKTKDGRSGLCYETIHIYDGIHARPVKKWPKET